MSSSQKPKARHADRVHEAVLVCEGGVPYVPSAACDPFESLAELMEVIEALCPHWPLRAGSLHQASFRL